MSEPTLAKWQPIDRTRYYAAHRAFALPALIEPSDSDPNYGRANDDFTPAEYGDYAARNLPVYVVSEFRVKNIGRLELKPYKVKPDGEREEVKAGNFLNLWRSPNTSPYWTSARLLRFLEWDRCLWGSAFWVMERGATGRGRVTEIWRAKPSNMRPVLDRADYIVGWVHEVNGERTPFMTSEVVWLPMDNPIDEFSGLSPLAPLRISVDIGYDAMRSNKARMANGMRLSAIISPAEKEMPFTDAQVSQITEQLRQLYAGVEMAGRAMVVSSGTRIDPLGMTPVELDYLGQLKWTLGDAARAYGIMPESVGDHEHATYSNVEQAEKANWINTLKPEGDHIADLMTRQFKDVFPGEFDLLAFDYSGIETLQEDRSEIVEQFKILLEGGVPLNRLLQEFLPELLPTTGDGYEWGDGPIWEAKADSTIAIAEATAPLKQPAMPPKGMPGQKPKALPSGNKGNPARDLLDALTRQMPYGSDEHVRIMRRFERQLDRRERQMMPMVADMFRRQQESVLARLREKARDAFSAESAPFDREEWERRWRQAMLPMMQDIMGDAAAEAMDDIGVSMVFDLSNPMVTAWLSERSQRFARQVNETTWDDLKATLGEGIDAGEGIDQLSDRVRSVMGDASEHRARMIARTETISASNAGGMEAARQSGVVKGKRWLAALDDRTRDAHRSAHGQMRGLDEPFMVDGEALMFPGDSSLTATAGNVINCRCTVTWVV